MFRELTYTHKHTELNDWLDESSIISKVVVSLSCQEIGRVALFGWSLPGSKVQQYIKENMVTAPFNNLVERYPVKKSTWLGHLKHLTHIPLTLNYQSVPIIEHCRCFVLTYLLSDAAYVRLYRLLITGNQLPLNKLDNLLLLHFIYNVLVNLLFDRHPVVS